jgi:hypothetical protein
MPEPGTDAPRAAERDLAPAGDAPAEQATSHILEKLGASTRTEAATAAHRLGLVA